MQQQRRYVVVASRYVAWILSDLIYLFIVFIVYDNIYISSLSVTSRSDY